MSLILFLRENILFRSVFEPGFSGVHAGALSLVPTRQIQGTA
jgi:hypothetical protein